MSSTKLTKELILDAAFSFYSEPRIVDFSMNELASKVGVSKPAIYRHFKNKEDVLDGMFKQFLDKISIPLCNMQESSKNDPDSVKVPFSETITFFAENPEYINYFINIFTRNTDFDSKFKNGLIERGIESESAKKYDKCKMIEGFYCGVTILFFLKFREKQLKLENVSSTESSSAKLFSEKLVDFILGGIEGNTDENDLIHPIKINEDRLKKLDELCSINRNEFPLEDKFFIALAKVICEHTMNGVTLERIANEMNLAKSSLYFYFDNKNQLIKSQIDRELSILTELCRENSIEALNYSEFIYITIRTEVEYFKMRPSILPICGWLLQHSTEDPFGKSDGVNNIWEKKIGKELLRPDFSFKCGPEVLTFWIGCIPVALMPLLSRHGFDDIDIDFYVKKIFKFIQFGLK